MHETIVALATPPLKSALAIIRLSGNNCFDVVEKVFTNKNNVIGEVQKNDGDYVAKPLNAFNTFTWSKPGHGTENYGAARDKKLIGGGK